jgi:hypothetical protein
MFRFLFILASASLLASCTPSIQTFSDRDSKYDLKKYRTYAWIAPGDSVLNRLRPDKYFDQLIIQSADAELVKKGMRQDLRSPDALFMYDTQVAEKIKYTQSPTVSVGVGFAGPGYYVGGMAPVAGGQVKASSYEEGTLVINMFDTKSGGKVWHGGAQKTLTSNTDIEKDIKTAVKYIYMRLPLKVKNK